MSKGIGRKQEKLWRIMWKKALAAAQGHAAVIHAVLVQANAVQMKKDPEKQISSLLTDRRLQDG